VFFLPTANRNLVALYGATGRELWRYDFLPTGQYASYPSYHGPSGLNRGVAYWADAAGAERRILLGTTDGRLLSVDARTGRLDPGFGTAGFVDLRAGAGREMSTTFYGLTSPPAIYRNAVILGFSAGEGKPTEAPGDIRAFDVRTGRELWRFHTVPRPGTPGSASWEGESWQNRGGANPWGGITVDAERGMIFAGTGSATYDFFGGDRRGANLYANSIVALNADDGELLWHYQVVHHDLWDYDLPTPPNLVTIRRDGREIAAVAQVTKMGFVFVLDRVTGEPLFPVDERPMPSSPIAGEQAWPTQPVPRLPAPLARQEPVRAEEVGGVTPEHDAFCRSLFERIGVNGGLYTPTADTLTLWWPGTMGGGEWSGAAYDPDSGYLYVTMNEIGALGTMVPGPEGGDLAYRRSTPREFRFWNPETRYPCQSPPWGTLSAVDLNDGRLVWRVPLGVFPELEARGIPATGTPNLGGVLVTAGGVVFGAGTMDERFRAFDAATGEMLWEAQLPAAGYAGPATYLGADGRQYVLVAAGGGGKWGTPSGDAFVAFALED
jgi:quinoprotein glucose dehydrogenase